MLNYPAGDKYSPFLYDAVMLYAMALNDTITSGNDPRNGTEVTKYAKGKVFRGIETITLFNNQYAILLVKLHDNDNDNENLLFSHQT